VDASIFHDNNQVVVDNNLQSPHYGRIYVSRVSHFFGTPVAMTGGGRDCHRWFG
jgi:hypothetical protein